MQKFLSEKLQIYFECFLLFSLTFIDMVKRKFRCKWDENSDGSDRGQETEINYPESDLTFLLPRQGVSKGE